MTDKLTADDMLRIMVDAVVRRLRDEAARREAVERVNPAAVPYGCEYPNCKCPPTGRCEEIAAAMPDAPPPPADDLVALLAELRSDTNQTWLRKRQRAAAAIEALRAEVKRSNESFTRENKIAREQQMRAEAAEARVAALEGALKGARQLADSITDAFAGKHPAASSENMLAACRETASRIRNQIDKALAAGGGNG